MNRRWLRAAAIAFVAGWAAWLSYATIDRPSARDVARSFTSLGGGPIGGGGGGLPKVTLSSSATNLASGSGNAANPLDVEACSTGNVSGSGSAGSCFNVVSSPSFSGITALAGFTNSGEVVATGSANPGALGAGPTYDWDWTNSGTASAIYVVNETPSADATIGGMLAGNTGQQIVLKNLSTTKKIILTNEDASETTAARRFTLPDAGDFTIRPSGSQIMRYTTSSRWVPLTTAVTDVGNGLTRSGSTASVNAGSGLTADSTNVRAALGTGLAFSSGNIAVSIAGGTCGAGLATTSVSSSGTATCASVNLNDYAGTHFEGTDEMLETGTMVNSTATPAMLVWSINSGSISQSAGNTTRPGIMTFSTSSSASGRSGQTSNLGSFNFSQGNFMIEAVVGFPTLGDGSDKYTAWIGFTDGNVANVANGCWMFYDRDNVTTGGPNSGNAQAWECGCASGSSRTMYLMNGTGNSDESFALGTATIAAETLSTNTNFYHVKMVVTGTTRAEFYYNGTKMCDINTHLPTTALLGAQLVLLKALGTNARTMDSDVLHWTADLTSARSP